ncbi:TNFAIP3-interacting protein 1-like [Acanthaster planci]|uniref:TNFAIP3-interacting protein 1-like n=1 Tax=Acanthaster planci TaxID=133434 RepID=A0A8B7XFH1_ACAPL|nr:TNFAIP3-interacting protein 1-like [Acanthaster planci]
MMEDARPDHIKEVNITSSFKGPPGRLECNPNDKDTNADQPSPDDPTSGPGPTTTSSSSSIGTLSEEFEHLSAHLMSNHGDPVNTSLRHDVLPDRPEVSMQIHNVELALQSLSKGNVATEITAHLTELVPKIIRLERKVKTQTILRGIFEEENQNLKSEVELIKEERDNIKEENRKLLEEVAELKRAKEDEHLGGFDYVTKKEACEIKYAEKKEKEKHRSVQGPAGVSEEDHSILQRKYASLKGQIEEIVKVNHSWDEHYRTMKAQLEARINILQKELDDAKNQILMLEKEQKVGDDMMVHEKARIEKAEKEHAGALAEAVAINQKCEKLERYARTLTGQRNEMEREIKRLNEALAKKIRNSEEESAGIYSEQQREQRASSPSASHQQGQHDQTRLIGHQKGVHEMTEAEMKEEIELLRQQNEVFQSDFTHERQDRQRVIGELDVMQKELRRTKKLLKQCGQEVVYQDPTLTHLQRDRHHYSASAPPHDYGYVVYQQPPARHNRPVYPQESGRLIPHGQGRRTYNLAANDVYIDGDDVEMDGGPRVSVEFNEAFSDANPTENDQNNRICPRCERTFDNDPDYHVHINTCLDN